MKDSDFLSKQPAAAVGMLLAIFKYHLFLLVWVFASVQQDSSSSCCFFFFFFRGKKGVLVVFWGGFPPHPPENRRAWDKLQATGVSQINNR